MSANQATSPPIAQLAIIVRPEPTGQFSAEPAGIPEIHIVAPTAEQAVAQVQQALASWPGVVHWASVGHSPSTALPAAAGHAKDDPDHEQYLQEIEKYRREVEARECSSSSSTPTT